MHPSIAERTREGEDPILFENYFGRGEPREKKLPFFLSLSLSSFSRKEKKKDALASSRRRRPKRVVKYAPLT
jgi:hypothetical protein